MRNKRNIAHKGEIDPNTIDLEFTYHAAAWIMAELIRCANGISMEEAGSLIKLVSEPVGTLVEEIQGIRMVHATVSTRSEILILLHSKHPDPVTAPQLIVWVGKKDSATRARISELKKDRLVVGSSETGYQLTSPGFNEAVDLIYQLQTVQV